jgi:hypothetical protein
VWPARGYSRTLGAQSRNTRATTQTHCIARLAIDYEGDLAPAGKAQWGGFEPPRAEPDGFLARHFNHSVIMLLPPEHTYPQQASQAPAIAKAADHCSRRQAHPMRGAMLVCICMASSRECQCWG